MKSTLSQPEKTREEETNNTEKTSKELKRLASERKKWRTTFGGLRSPACCKVEDEKDPLKFVGLSKLKFVLDLHYFSFQSERDHKII